MLLTNRLFWGNLITNHLEKTWISQNPTELYSFLGRNRSGVITIISAKLLSCCIFVFQMPFLTGASWCFSLTTATEYRWRFWCIFLKWDGTLSKWKQQEVKIWIYPRPGKWKVTVVSYRTVVHQLAPCLPATRCCLVYVLLDEAADYGW